MESLYSQEKVEKAVEAVFDAVEPLGVNLLELAQAAKAVYVSCEMQIAVNMRDAEEQREATLNRLREAL